MMNKGWCAFHGQTDCKYCDQSIEIATLEARVEELEGKIAQANECTAVQAVELERLTGEVAALTIQRDAALGRLAEAGLGLIHAMEDAGHLKHVEALLDRFGGDLCAGLEE